MLVHNFPGEKKKHFLGIHPFSKVFRTVGACDYRGPCIVHWGVRIVFPELQCSLESAVLDFWAFNVCWLQMTKMAYSRQRVQMPCPASLLTSALLIMTSIAKNDILTYNFKKCRGILIFYHV